MQEDEESPIDDIFGDSMARHLGVQVLPPLDPTPRCLFSKEWSPKGSLDNLQAVTSSTKKRADFTRVKAYLQKYLEELGNLCEGMDVDPLQAMAGEDSKMADNETPPASAAGSESDGEVEEADPPAASETGAMRGVKFLNSATGRTM